MHRADPNWRTALDQPRLDLDQGPVALLGNRLPDRVATRLDLARMPVTAACLGESLTMLQSKLSPADALKALTQGEPQPRGNSSRRQLP